MNNDYRWTFNYTQRTTEPRPGGYSRCISVWVGGVSRSELGWLGLFASMLLQLTMCNCDRNIAPLFRIADAKFHTTKFRALPHSGSGNGLLPLLRLQLQPLPPLLITLGIVNIPTYHEEICLKFNVVNQLDPYCLSKRLFSPFKYCVNATRWYAVSV